MNREASDALDVIALFDPGSRSGRICHHVPRYDALRAVHPGDTVIRQDIAGALLIVKNGKNDGRKRKDG
jgi:hypothetical protein